MTITVLEGGESAENGANRRASDEELPSTPPADYRQRLTITKVIAFSTHVEVP